MFAPLSGRVRQADMGSVLGRHGPATGKEPSAVVEGDDTAAEEAPPLLSVGRPCVSDIAERKVSC
jgi:hypothetical protein